MSSSKPRLSTTGSSLTATFSTACSRFLALAALSLALASCAVAPSTSTLPLAVWSQHGPAGQLAVRAIVAEGLPCPLASVENQARTMRVRAGGNGKTAAGNDKNPTFEPPFAVASCEIDVPATTGQVEVGGQPVAMPKATVQRIVLLGDTGCRIKISANGQGDPLQDCSSADAWPWARIARAAAREKPDLVIHVGDYHYREYCDDPLRCTPLRERGVVVSYGWVGWQADFFVPAAPLLAQAPWVFVRGNHENCDRGGEGWMRFLSPSPYLACTDQRSKTATRSVLGNNFTQGQIRLPLRHSPRHAGVPGRSSARFPARTSGGADFPDRRHRRFLGDEPQHQLDAGPEHRGAEAAAPGAARRAGGVHSRQSRRSAARLLRHRLRRHRGRRRARSQTGRRPALPAHPRRQFDQVTRHHRWVAVLGDKAYDLLVRINRLAVAGSGAASA
jgi:hypothetical protein